MSFNRETRYVVVKVRDIFDAGCTQEEIDAFNVLCDKVHQYRLAAGKDLLDVVVVESDWPEYEPTWKAIEDRMNGVKPQGPDMGAVVEALETAVDWLWGDQGAKYSEKERIFQGLYLIKQALFALKAGGGS